MLKIASFWSFRLSTWKLLWSYFYFYKSAERHRDGWGYSSVIKSKCCFLFWPSGLRFLFRISFIFVYCPVSYLLYYIIVILFIFISRSSYYFLWKSYSCCQGFQDFFIASSLIKKTLFMWVVSDRVIQTIRSLEICRELLLLDDLLLARFCSFVARWILLN